MAATFNLKVEKSGAKRWVFFYSFRKQREAGFGGIQSVPLA
jgi:hypothetical protein